jgi:hypothetical protein
MNTRAIANRAFCTFVPTEEITALIANLEYVLEYEKHKYEKQIKEMELYIQELHMELNPTSF